MLWYTGEGRRRVARLDCLIPSTSTSMTTTTPKLIIRLDLGPFGRLGPGKIQLLTLIGELGSISAASRAMNMSYRQAWDLVHQLNETFSEPVVISQTGGKSGGGAALTDAGRQLVAELKALQADAESALARHLQFVAARLRSSSPSAAE